MGGVFSQRPESPPDSSIPGNSHNPDLPNSSMSSPSPATSSDSSIDKDSQESKNVEEVEKDLEEEEEEEEGECGFCLFMKGGGCRESFIAWENCIQESEKNKEDIVDKCFEVTGMLKKCMEAHSDYYEPILRAEKAAEEEVKKELEKEKKEEEIVAEKEAEKLVNLPDSSNP